MKTTCVCYLFVLVDLGHKARSVIHYTYTTWYVGTPSSTIHGRENPKQSPEIKTFVSDNFWLCSLFALFFLQRFDIVLLTNILFSSHHWDDHGNRSWCRLLSVLVCNIFQNIRFQWYVLNAEVWKQDRIFRLRFGTNILGKLRNIGLFHNRPIPNEFQTVMYSSTSYLAKFSYFGESAGFCLPFTWDVTVQTVYLYLVHHSVWMISHSRMFWDFFPWKYTKIGNFTFRICRKVLLPEKVQF